ncbi:diguanylate cyclase domain-containing protein [Pectobacterium sp. B1J-3]|uniref:diguanylate cyclase domain-containing protein n=1 Tax=Pectobacterium sp. B1J-3 TaxID=3385371 RepID=UPI003905D3E6
MNGKRIHSYKEKRKITFKSALTRISTITLTITMAVSWTLITTASLISFKQFSEKNLQLLAYTLSQSVEAAVVFRDGTAAYEKLNDLGQQGQFSSAVVTDDKGNTLTKWHSKNSILTDTTHKVITRWILPDPVIQPIYHQGELIGNIEVSGERETVEQFILSSLTILTLCVILVSAISIFISKYLHNGLILALKRIIDVVHDIRVSRNFSRRIPSGNIVEIDILSQGFNSLMSEVEHWQYQILKEKDSLLKRSLRDPLTGIANRTAFCSMLESLLKDKKKKSNIALLFMDGNKFKDVNDTYGHAIGDEVLIHIANRLSLCADDNALPARLGGDEFALIFVAENLDKECIDTVIDKINKKMSAPICLSEGITIIMSLSIGAVIADEHSTPKSLMEQADKNMYSEKRKHHNVIVT